MWKSYEGLIMQVDILEHSPNVNILQFEVLDSVKLSESAGYGLHVGDICAFIGLGNLVVKSKHFIFGDGEGFQPTLLLIVSKYNPFPRELLNDVA